MAKIVPSILETSKDKFLDTYSREVKLSGVEKIQVDFGDGIFVPNKILPISEIDVLNPAFEWEAHLMVSEPKDFLDYQICGFKTIIIHYEAYKSGADLAEAISSIKNVGMEACLCIKNETPVSVLKVFEDRVKRFQIMGVDPGMQGRPLLPNTVSKIAELRNLCPNAIISVDGGINETNIKSVVQAGADYIVVGSVLTKAEDMGGAWEKLNQHLTIDN